MLQPWWTRDSTLIREEIAALQRYGFRVRQTITTQGRLELAASEGQRRFWVTYAHNFPDGGVSIVDGPADDPEARLIWHYGPVPVGAGAVDKLEHERPIDHIRGSGFRVLAVREWAIVDGDGGALLLASSGGPTHAAIGLTGCRRERSIVERSIPLVAGFAKVHGGTWVRGDPPDWSDDNEVIAARIERDLANFHRRPLAQVREELRTGGVGALAYGEPSLMATQWLFVTRTTDGIAQLGRMEFYTTDGVTARAPFSAQLAHRAVAIVGCGALGWSIAVALARAGVGRFVLYDRDVVHVANLPRLGSRLSWIGEPKVDALAHELRQVAPGIVVSAAPYTVGEQVGPSALIADEVDLIIDATADPRSPDATNLASVGSTRPVVYAWTAGGVVAARIFRVRPGRSACYACVRSAELPMLRTDTPTGSAWEFAWNGANFNLDMVAAVATRMAVRTLLGHPMDQGNPDHIVLDLGGPAPRWRALTVARDPHCGVCRE